MFSDSKVSSLFKKLGYVKYPMLDESEIDEILQLYNDTKGFAGVNKSFFTSIWSDNVDYKKAVDLGLKKILIPSLDKTLSNFKAVFANFMVKISEENSHLPPHQDWSFVDEPEFESMTVWIPLSDVDKSNGALEVCPKSHLLENYKRARFSNSPFMNDLGFIEKNLMQSIPMKKGEALFINSRTIHSSPSNLSPKDRIAASIVVVPFEAPMIHYVLDRENDSYARRLQIEPDFFIRYSCFDYPEINPLNEKTLLSGEKPTINDLTNLTSS